MDNLVLFILAILFVLFRPKLLAFLAFNLADSRERGQKPLKNLSLVVWGLKDEGWTLENIFKWVILNDTTNAALQRPVC
jgi:hypothetical protein